MGAIITESKFDNPDGPLRDSGPILRDKIVKVETVEKARSFDEEIEDEFYVSGGEESTVDEDQTTTIELEEVSIDDIGNIIKALNKRFGTSYLKWEPETLFMVLKDELKEDLPDEIKERILAARSFAVEGPWKEWNLFEKAAIGVSGGAVTPGYIQYVSPEDIARAIKMMNEVSPGKSFSDEVLRYIAARLYTDSILWIGDIYPVGCQKYIIELGASKALIDSCRDRFNELADTPIEKLKLSENLIDMQVGRIIGIRHLINNE